jgi:hypothetical protein
MHCKKAGRKDTFYENEIAGDDAFGWRFDVCSNPILYRR